MTLTLLFLLKCDVAGHSRDAGGLLSGICTFDFHKEEALFLFK